MRSFACVVAVLSAGCGDSGIQTADESALRSSAPDATVVLVHGMGGFKDLAGVDYFWRVPSLYQSLGAKVFVPGLTSFASIEERAAELAGQLAAVEGPLVIVAHSQGGLDARYLITRLGFAPRVKALVTIATPHRGSPVADVALGLAAGPVEDATNALIGVFGWSLAGAQEVTVAYTTQVFNPSVPDMPGVTYWSYSGRATPLGIGSGDGWVHAALLPTWSFLTADVGASDGMVPEASAHWGQFQGSLPADHLGEVGQPLGETPDFDAQSFYRSLLARFRDQGW